MNRYYLKILLPAFIAILLFVMTIFGMVIPHFRQSIMEGKRETIQELVNSAWSILDKYQKEEQNGTLTRTEAQQIAVSRIQYLRYGEQSKDYFWITDLHPNMVMHPYRPELNGKDLSNFSDSHGQKMFVEFVKTVKAQDHGYVNYMWQWKDDSTHIVPKLSFVKIFKPWGWVIGTGIYIEDVEKEINQLTEKLWWISGGISVLVLFLMAFILMQSLKTEKERIAAEQLLNESKEKYRTLVEASSEGLIMIIDHKISFINQAVVQITGYRIEELVNQSFLNFLCQNNNKAVLDRFANDQMGEGSYELMLKHQNGRFVEVLVTSSSTIFNDKVAHILIVKKTKPDTGQMIKQYHLEQLVGKLDIGFYHVKLDHEGQFVQADATTLAILGYPDFEAIQNEPILDLIADPKQRKWLIKTLNEQGIVKGLVLRIKKRNQQIAHVVINLVLLNATPSDKMQCIGTIEDVSASVTELDNQKELIKQFASLYTSYTESIVPLIKPAQKVDINHSIFDALKLMNTYQHTAVLVMNQQTDLVGFVSESDIRKRVYDLRLQLDNPIYLIMSSPVASIEDTCSVYQAFEQIQQSQARHLVVKNTNAQVLGVLSFADLQHAMLNKLNFFSQKISLVSDIDSLYRIRQTAITFWLPLIEAQTPVQQITQLTSQLAHDITQRIIQLSIEKLGPPPTHFAFIAMGSEGRQEETLLTDQDNALIFDDSNDEKLQVIHKTYFDHLSNLICDGLHQVGYTYCKGGIMAKNTVWCQPLFVWKNYFSKWISTPEPKNLLEGQIFFDYKLVWGEKSLIESLTEHVDLMLKHQALFLYLMAENARSVKVPSISGSGLMADKNATDSIDIKNLTGLMTMIVRTYALNHQIHVRNTFLRIEALAKHNVLNQATADEMKYVYQTLLYWRFRHQSNQIRNQKEINNLVNTNELMDIELRIYKRILALLTEYQNKLASDFKLYS